MFPYWGPGHTLSKADEEAGTNLTDYAAPFPTSDSNSDTDSDRGIPPPPPYTEPSSNGPKASVAVPDRPVHTPAPQLPSPEQARRCEQASVIARYSLPLPVTSRHGGDGEKRKESGCTKAWAVFLVLLFLALFILLIVRGSMYISEKYGGHVLRDFQSQEPSAAVVPIVVRGMHVVKRIICTLENHWNGYC